MFVILYERSMSYDQMMNIIYESMSFFTTILENIFFLMRVYLFAINIRSIFELLWWDKKRMKKFLEEVKLICSWKNIILVSYGSEKIIFVGDINSCYGFSMIPLKK